MINTNRLASIHFLKPTKGFTFELHKNIYFSTDKKIVDSFFTPADIIPIIGHNEFSSIKDCGVFIYAGLEIEGSEDSFNERVFLINFLLLIELFCQSSWFVKDNSIQSELGHLVYQTKKTFKVHSNFWHSAYTNCRGKREDTSFSPEEIKETLEMMSHVFSVSYVGPELINSSVKVTQKVSRLARAFYFLQSARGVEDLGTKLAHYCSVFESVFSTSNTELRHRLSETVAFFLEPEYEKRLEVYRILQMAYDVRSSIVHGDGVSTKFLKNDYDLLIETTIKTDEILRRSLKKILANEELLTLFTEKTQQEVSNFTQGLIFQSS